MIRRLGTETSISHKKRGPHTKHAYSKALQSPELPNVVFLPFAPFAFYASPAKRGDLNHLKEIESPRTATNGLASGVLLSGFTKGNTLNIAIKIHSPFAVEIENQPDREIVRNLTENFIRPSSNRRQPDRPLFTSANYN